MNIVKTPVRGQEYQSTTLIGHLSGRWIDFANLAKSLDPSFDVAAAWATDPVVHEFMGNDGKAMTKYPTAASAVIAIDLPKRREVVMERARRKLQRIPPVTSSRCADALRASVRDWADEVATYHEYSRMISKLVVENGFGFCTVDDTNPDGWGSMGLGLCCGDRRDPKLAELREWRKLAEQSA
jgi:hypothetical protein